MYLSKDDVPIEIKIQKYEGMQKILLWKLVVKNFHKWATDKI